MGEASPTVKQRHTALYKGSDYYRAVFDRFGKSVNRETAESLCKSHGFTLSQLQEWEEITVPVSGRVSTLALVESLGY